MFMSTIIPDTIQFFKNTLCLMLAYIVAVTLAGAFTAWVAKKMGDDTADYAGFLTLDPLVHVDPIGAIVLVLLRFGWGREIPIDIYAIKPPLRDLKILITYYSSTFLHTFLIILSIITLALMQAYAITTGSVSEIVTNFFQAFIGLNSGLGLLRFIQASVDLIFIPLKVDDEQAIRIVSLATTFLILFLLGTRIQYFFYKLSIMISIAILGLFS